MKAIFLALLVSTAPAWAAASPAAREIVNAGGTLEGEEIIPQGTAVFPGSANLNFGRPRGSSPGLQASLLSQVALGNRPALAEVPLPSCASGQPSLRAFRLRFLTGPVRLLSLKIIARDGSSHVVRLPREFSPNTDTNWIHLNKKGLCPRALQLEGVNANLSPFATSVQIFGLLGR